MQAECRRSLIWAVPFLMVALAGWVAPGSARAADAPGLDLTAPCAAADGLDVAALAAPDWAQEPASPAMGTESAPAMGTEAPGMAGGASCTSNKGCHDTKMLCLKENGHCKAKGTCTAKPDVCPDVVDPVCGCNGRTYNNECMAHRAGVNVRAKGKCKAKKPAKTDAAAAKPAN